MLASLLLILSIYFYNHYFGSELKGASDGPITNILYWNVAQNQPLPIDILAKHIKESKPEIVALVEAFEVSEEDLTLLKTTFPDYHFQVLNGEMMIGVKGTIESIFYKAEGVIFRYNYVKIKKNNLLFSVMIADVYADPLINKEIPLDIIYTAAQHHNIDILVGDFNTPYESAYFNRFKDDFYSFHNYSLGLTFTWPTPIALIEIDQIWINKSLQPIKLKKFSYNCSDHKLLIAEYR